MISLGQDSKLGQLESHSFTAIPGPTVHNPTALFTNITQVTLIFSDNDISKGS